MQSTGREPSMEDILASIKKVIAEEKESRSGVEAALNAQAQEDQAGEDEEDVLELDQPVASADLGPPLLDDSAAETARSSLSELSSVAASAPPPSTVNPLEEMVREMLRPMLKQWLDDNLPEMVSEHVRREISRITGRPVK